MEYNDELVNKAYLFAKDKHSEQVRKYTDIPYIIHPSNVSKLVSKYMDSYSDINKYKIVGLLHDTLEDTGTTYMELVDLFGLDIACMVFQLTSNNKNKRLIGKTKYLERKMVNMSDEVLIIKLCDRLDNISTLDEDYIDSEFRIKYFKETCDIMNYLINNRELNDIHKDIISDIYNKLIIISGKINNQEEAYTYLYKLGEFYGNCN